MNSLILAIRLSTLPLVLALFLFQSGDTSALAQSSIDDEFNSGDLDWQIWCPCQINMVKAPIRFPPDSEEPGDRVGRIVVDDNSLGGNKCRSSSECRPPKGSLALGTFVASEEIDDAPDMVETLGPSLIRQYRILPKAALPENPHCTDEVMRRALAAGEEDECIQRQELRFQKWHRHNVTEPHLYSFRVRMPAKIEDRINSIRWVIAQWKHEPINGSYCREFNCKKWGQSPFLALRFDDGVLHVTVQDEHCRCVVASAPFPDGSNLSWTDGRAQYCASSRPGDPDGTPCRSRPDLFVEYGKDPILSTALGSWVEMKYRVEANRPSDAVIEVHEGERFIVRVKGKIGYDFKPRNPSMTKFKLGPYRDYMPFVHAMEIDWQGMVPIKN